MGVNTIALTGNQGYIGSIMEDELLSRGYVVRGIDAGYFEGKTFVPLSDAVVSNRAKHQVIRDVRDAQIEDFEGIDVVIHLAALSNDPLGALNERLTDEINYKGTVNVATLAKAAGVKRFLYSSSCSMYGAADVSKPLDETADFNPVTAYAQSKVDSEKSLEGLCDDAFAVTSMRNATVFGVSPRMRFDLVINNLGGYAHTTNQVVMKSDGKPWRPVVHVRDVSKAFRTVLESDIDIVRGNAYNVGSNDLNYTVRELADIVVEGFVGSELVCLGEVSGDTRSYKIDFSKIASELGYVPDWTVERGVEELRTVYREVLLDETLFNDEFFTTLKRMTSLLERGEIKEEDLRWEN